MSCTQFSRRGGWRSGAELETAAARSTTVNEAMADDVRWIRSYVLDAKAAVCSGTGASTRQRALRRSAGTRGSCASRLHEIVPIADRAL